MPQTAIDRLHKQTKDLCDLIESPGFLLLGQDIKDAIHVIYRAYVNACIEAEKETKEDKD